MLIATFAKVSWVRHGTHARPEYKVVVDWQPGDIAAAIASARRQFGLD